MYAECNMFGVCVRICLQHVLCINKNNVGLLYNFPDFFALFEWCKTYRTQIRQQKVTGHRSTDGRWPTIVRKLVYVCLRRAQVHKPHCVTRNNYSLLLEFLEYRINFVATFVVRFACFLFFVQVKYTNSHQMKLLQQKFNTKVYNFTSEHYTYRSSGYLHGNVRLKYSFKSDGEVLLLFLISAQLLSS